jgi:hypothetical protein
MARLALAVGYTSRTNSRSEDPRLLYLGSSYQAAKEAAAAPPEGIGYTEAYRLDSGPNKRQHHDLPVPAAEAAPVLDLLDESPPKPAAKKASPAKEEPAADA